MTSGVLLPCSIAMLELFYFLLVIASTRLPRYYTLMQNALAVPEPS